MANHTISNTTTSEPTSAGRDGPVRATATEYASAGNVLMPLERPLPERLLGVWAHPDDECYLSAGLMARVIESGGEVTVVTATRGEKGTDDPTAYDSDEFAAERERELIASLGELGVTDLRFLGLRDGECDSSHAEAAIGGIVDVMLEFRPDTVVTFGPDGITGHADHLTISRRTTEAWRRVGPVGFRPELLYATITHDYVARYRALHDEIGLFADRGAAGPASISRRDVKLECSLSEFELDRKRRALAAHGSQTAGLADLMGEATYRGWWRDERFRAPSRSEVAACPVPFWMRDGSRSEDRLAVVS
jgi:LmbE family N-acetylglucosaminyl deacetylase